MKYFIVLVLMIGGVNLFAKEAMLEETPFSKVQSHLLDGKPTFMEVGSDRCHSCQEMGKRLYKTVQKHPKSEIFFVNVHKEREAASKLGVQIIPTQIIVDGKGKELYRHMGVLEPKEIEDLLKKYKF